MCCFQDQIFDECLNVSSMLLLLVSIKDSSTYNLVTPTLRCWIHVYSRLHPPKSFFVPVPKCAISLYFSIRGVLHCIYRQTLENKNWKKYKNISGESLKETIRTWEKSNGIKVSLLPVDHDSWSIGPMTGTLTPLILSDHLFERRARLICTCLHLSLTGRTRKLWALGAVSLTSFTKQGVVQHRCHMWFTVNTRFSLGNDDKRTSRWYLRI